MIKSIKYVNSLSDKKITISKFEKGVEKYIDSKGNIDKYDMRKYLEKMKLDINYFDIKLICYYYRDEYNKKNMIIDDFLNEIEKQLKRFTTSDDRKLKRRESTIRDSEDIPILLRQIAVKTEIHKLNLKQKITKYDMNCKLKEDDFYYILKNSKLSLATDDIDKIIEKYYNSTTNKITANQFLADLKKCQVPNIDDPQSIPNKDKNIYQKCADIMVSKRIVDKIILGFWGK
jgi:hypothetical protein